MTTFGKNLKKGGLYEVLPQSGPASGHYVTVVKTPKPCGKHAWVDDEGNTQFKSQGTDPTGTGRVVHVPTPDSLLELLASLGTHEYLTLDFVPQTVGLEAFTVLTQHDHAERFPGTELHPVRKDGRVYVCGNLNDWVCGNWRLIDRDLDDNTPDDYRVPFDAWLAMAERLLPGLARAPRVSCPSSKGRVVREDGSAAATSLNSHTYVDCSAGSVKDSTRMGNRLILRADALGMVWRVPRKSRKTGEDLGGKGSQRTILDTSVWSPHRVIYAGAPTVDAGLRLTAHQGTAVDGTPINLQDVLPEPTNKAIKAYEKRSGNEVKIKEGSLSITDRGALSLEDEVWIFGHAQPMTLWQFWKDPQFKFEEGYRSQTIVRESDSWNGILRKYAGGVIMQYDNGAGVNYLLDVNKRPTAPDDRDSVDNGNVDEPAPIVEYRDEVDRMGEIPFPPGLAGEVAEFAMRYFHMPNKAFACAAALQTLSTLNANYCYVEPRTALNLYQCLVGATGAGKEDPRKFMKEVLRETGCSVPLLESAASGPALLRALGRQPNTLLCMDEMGLVLQASSGSHGAPYLKELFKDLMSLHGLGRTSYGGKCYADEKKNIGEIVKPYVCLMGTTTPSTLADGLSKDNIDSGLVNRIIFVEVKDKDKAPVNRQQAATVPAALVKRLRTVCPPIPPAPQRAKALTYAPGVKDELIRLATEMAAAGATPALWVRCEELTIRVAGCLALGGNGVITLEHVAWAVDWVRRGLLALEKTSTEDMGDTPFEKLRSKALKMVRNPREYAKDMAYKDLCLRGYLPRGKLMKNLKIKARELDDVVAALIESGEIGEQVMDDTTVYFARNEDRE